MIFLFLLCTNRKVFAYGPMLHIASHCRRGESALISTPCRANDLFIYSKKIFCLNLFVVVNTSAALIGKLPNIVKHFFFLSRERAMLFVRSGVLRTLVLRTTFVRTRRTAIPIIVICCRRTE